MASITYQFVTLLLLISCIVWPTESRYKEKDRDRKYDKATPHGEYPSPATVAAVNLCSKNRDLKLVCHCSPDDSVGRARKAECWIFHTELMRHDPNWLTFHTQTNLDHLRIVIQSIGILKYVPTEAIRLLKQLKVLSIEYGQLEDVQSFAFGNLTQLKNVTLANNQIKFVYRNAFANHPALEEIDLKENAIVDIDQEAFVNLRQLARLNLAKNNLTVLHDGTFQELSGLKELNLRLNDINVLTREVFRGLGNLRFLDLSENELTFIGDTVFAELWSLQELYLNSNNIEKISERAFDGLNNLKILNLHSNRLKMLERGLFTGAPAVKTLNLADNLLETLTFNNMLPLMDNLVNHTSVLTITDNKFICDCRLAWMYDVEARTRCEDLRRTLRRVKCHLENGVHHLHHPHRMDLFDNSINEHVRTPGSGHGNDEDTSAYYDDEVTDTTGAIDLFKLGIDELPCPEELIDPTELPLSHKSMGVDMSWLTHAASGARRVVGTVARWVLLISLVTLMVMKRKFV